MRDSFWWVVTLVVLLMLLLLTTFATEIIAQAVLEALDQVSLGLLCIKKVFKNLL